MRLIPVDFKHKGQEHGGWATVNIEYVSPKLLRDFPFLKGKWVPTSRVGTHADFDCWFPAVGAGSVYVRDSEEACLRVCNKFEQPMQITEDYPMVAVVPLALVQTER